MTSRETQGSSLGFDDNAFGQSLEPITVGLDNRDGYVAGLAHVDVPHDPGLALVNSAGHFTFGAVFEVRS